LKTKTGIHLVIFGGGSFNLRAAGRRLKREALNSKIFTSVQLDDERSLRRNYPEFVSKHRNFFESNKLGYGKWIWKPFLILNAMKKNNGNDIFIYLDSGCHLNLDNQNARIRFQDYIKICLRFDSLGFQLLSGQFGIQDLTDRTFSQPQFEYMKNLNKDYIWKSNQIMAGVIFLKGTQRNREFLEEWGRRCNENYYYYLDSVALSSKGFELEKYRWDQSIFSTLFKDLNLHYIDDETFFYPHWAELGTNFPIWTMRWKQGNSPIKNNLSLIDIKELIFFRFNMIYRKFVGFIVFRFKLAK